LKAGFQVIRTPPVSLVDGSKVQIRTEAAADNPPVTMKWRANHECSGPTACEND
jgi:hypothetical protein